MILTIPLLNNAMASKDIFGVEKIYPTKEGGQEWYMDMNDPLLDERFDPYNLLAMEDRVRKTHYSRLYEIKTILGKWFLLQTIHE